MRGPRIEWIHSPRLGGEAGGRAVHGDGRGLLRALGLVLGGEGRWRRRGGEEERELLEEEERIGEEERGRRHLFRGGLGF